MKLLPTSSSNIRSVAFGQMTPKILRGDSPVITIDSLASFSIEDSHAEIKAMYQGFNNQKYERAGTNSVNALLDLKGIDTKRSAIYPRTTIAENLRDTATLIKAKLGLQIVVAEVNDYDTHAYQGGAKGPLADHLSELADALAAFKQDLGAEYSNVCVVSFTEFGRTLKETGMHSDGGTDHGHGSAMLVMGGNVKGGKVYGDWKELSPANLYEERDVPVTTDFRSVFAEALRGHLGISSLSSVFPGFSNTEKVGFFS
jgi:uncharacterized protein (DUF1501 family)